MLFNEIYGAYFKIVAKLIEEAVEGTLDTARIAEIIEKEGFAESTLSIPEKIKTQEWPIIKADGSTPICEKPSVPLTVLQKRWLKTLLGDPRIKLFHVDGSGLENIEPLYDVKDIVLFDQYADGDDYESETYRRNFRTILSAVENGQSLEINFASKTNKRHRWICKPEKIEYSLKDDKFRIHVKDREHRSTINIGRIIECRITSDHPTWSQTAQIPGNKKVIIKIKNERNTLERAMLHFSDLQKETVRISREIYNMTLFYNPEDETELLIRILSFGPTLKVIEPESFVELIKERLHMQRQL